MILRRDPEAPSEGEVQIHPEREPALYTIPREHPSCWGAQAGVKRDIIPCSQSGVRRAETRSQKPGLGPDSCPPP